MHVYNVVYYIISHCFSNLLPQRYAASIYAKIKHQQYILY